MIPIITRDPRPKTDQSGTYCLESRLWTRTKEKQENHGSIRTEWSVPGLIHAVVVPSGQFHHRDRSKI